MNRATDISAVRLTGRLRLHVLASGSKGNCSIIEDVATGECIAVDCGISWKAFRERCVECGVDPLRVRAVLVTHEHTDHTKGLGVMMRGMAKLGAAPVLYASRAVCAASADIGTIADTVDLRYFASGDLLGFGAVGVYAFPTSHDAAESFGFRFDCGGDAIGFMTDTGVVTGEAAEALAGCRALALEANHDVDMLAHGPYPAYLKARVASDRGHLSNGQAAAFLQTLLDDRLESVVGMHVSQNNNDYRLPREALAGVLARNDHPAQALVGYQNHPISL